MTKKKNIIALSPHADDVEIAMGGTIAKYVDEQLPYKDRLMIHNLNGHAIIIKLKNNMFIK